jgi:hypothetical protein
MNALSKYQKDEYATAFAMLALYDGGVRGAKDADTCFLKTTLLRMNFSL